MALDKPLDAGPAAVREALAPLRNDFSVAIVCPGNAFALGAVIRVAHSFLAREILVVGGGTWYAKASMGMEKYETIRRVAGITALLDDARARGRPLWAIEKDHSRRSLHAVERFPPNVILTFGSERFGLPRALVDAADDVVGIPMYGVNHSLPVAVAAGIVMHEWARRRYAGGATA